MIKSLYTAASGMKAQQTNVDTISNNLANVNTAGYKRTLATFQDMMYVAMKSPGLEQNNAVSAPVGIEIGSGARMSSTTRVFSQGVLEETRAKLDVAIEGDGFLAVTLPDGSTAYTRDGHLLLDAEGKLVTAQGYSVSPQITLGSDVVDVSISPEGIVNVKTRGNPEQTTPAGNLQLTRFINPAGLEALGGNVFRQSAASGQGIPETPGRNGMGQLRQGYLERSNVDVVNELVAMIVAQRAYEVNSRAIRSSDDMLSQANALVR
jgi:flagellar basal-body rod protein FlgG